MVFEEKRPAGESTADTPLKPLEGRLALSCQRQNAGDLIIGVMRVPKGFWARTGSGHAVQSLWDLTRQCIKHTLETNDEWFFRQELQRFSKQSLRHSPVPRHHVWLRSKIYRVLVGGTF